jgi:flagellar biogenesis protein FliO
MGALALALDFVVRALALAIALVLFVAGRWVFRRLSPHFEDFV